MTIVEGSALYADFDGDGKDFDECSRKEETEWSVEQIAFLESLRIRYESNTNDLVNHTQVAWQRVEARLRLHPEKLDALKRMDESGGAPDVTGFEGEEILFDEVAQELPKSRRGLSYVQAVARAKAMGSSVNLMHPKRYVRLASEMGILMDIVNDPEGGNYVWLDTADSPELLRDNFAYQGYQYCGNVMTPFISNRYSRYAAFRCALRV